MVEILFFVFSFRMIIFEIQTLRTDVIYWFYYEVINLFLETYDSRYYRFNTYIQRRVYVHHSSFFFLEKATPFLIDFEFEECGQVQRH